MNANKCELNFSEFYYDIEPWVTMASAYKDASLLILENMEHIRKKGFDTQVKGQTLTQYIDGQAVAPIGDTYTIRDAADVRLTGLAEHIIQRGMIGRNYVARELIEKMAQRMRKNIYARRRERKLQEIEAWEQANLGGKSQQEAVHIVHPLNVPPIAGNLPLQPSKCVSYDMAPLQIGKLLTIYGSTHSACQDMEILLHRSPQIICYTGRFFESGGTGTTGLKKSIKAENYELIEGVTGLKIYTCTKCRGTIC